MQKSGSFYKYGGATIGQGKEKAAQYLSDQPQLIDTIRAQVMSAVSGVVVELPVAEASLE